MADKAVDDYLKALDQEKQAKQDPAVAKYLEALYQQQQKGNAPPPPLAASPATPKLSPYGKPLTGAYNPQQTEAYRNNPANQDVIGKIRDAAMTRYGNSNDSTVLGLSNKVTNEGYPLEIAMQMLQGGYGQTNPDVIRAGDEVGSQYDSQQNALTRLMDRSRQDYNMQIDTQKNYGTTADAHLDELYNSLRAELGKGQEATRAIYDRGQQQVANAYGGAQANVQGAYQGIQGDMASMAQQLGLEEAIPSASGQLNEQLMNFLTANGNAQAQAGGNLATLGTEVQGIGQRGIDDSQKEETQQRAGLANTVAQGINQAGYDFNQNNQELQGQMSDLNQERGAALRLAIEDVRTARTEQERQQKLDALAEEIQRGTLDIQRGQLDISRQELGLSADNQKFQQNLDTQKLGLDQQQLGLQKQELETKLQNSGIMSELDVQKSLADLALINAKIDAAQKGGSGKQRAGQLGLMDFYQQTGANETFQRNVAGIIQDALNEASKPAAFAGPQQDPYQIALRVVDTYKLTSPDLAKAALTIFFKKY